MKSLTSAQTTRILSLLDQGKSAHQVASITGQGIATISRLCSKHRSSLSKVAGGRPPKLSSSDLHYSIRQITSQKTEHATELSKTLQEMNGESISARTVRRALRKVGMKAVVKRKRPLLTKRHRRERLDFAMAHKDWTVEDWKRVVWSDETKINCLGSDGRKWVWKKPGEGLSDRLVDGTVKFGGGSLMFWGCMLWEGPGYGTKIDGRMDAKLYVGILEDELQESLKYYKKRPVDIIFQQDNDPKHKSKMAMNWLEDSGMEVMIWPPQSADLNPIEHLWHHLKKRLGEYEAPPTSIHVLWERVQKEWNEIPAAVCQNLIESMPRRIEAVLQAKGGYTKY